MSVASVIPQGYMPSQGEPWTITICTPDGVQEITVSADNPDQDPGQHPTKGIHHDACAFAGIAQLALHSNETVPQRLPVLLSSVPSALSQRDIAAARHVAVAEARAPPRL